MSETQDTSNQTSGLSDEELLDLLKTVAKLSKITSDVIARTNMPLKEVKSDVDQ
jgi:hypothetical protein